MLPNPMEQDPREDKLPKWAQQTIDTLRIRVKTMQDINEETRLATNPDESDTILRRFDTDGGDIGLGNRPLIRFYLEPADGLRNPRARKAVDVNVLSNGNVRIAVDGTLVVYPSASNSIQVTAIR